MKVQELSGADLDYWVAKAEGYGDTIDNGWPSFDAWANANDWAPTTNWSDCGPIIEREKIAVEPMHGDIEPWIARIQDPRGPNRLHCYGSTPLIAAMRAYVASKYGDEVPDANS